MRFVASEFVEKLRTLLCEQSLDDVERAFTYLEKASKAAVIQTDHDFYDKFQMYAKSVGSCGIFLLIIGDYIISINVGDSKAVLCRDGKPYRLNFEHKVVNWLFEFKLRK